MFTSCGNFRGLNCPFYAQGSGVCRRPYCHFRHVRSTSRTETEKPQSSRPPGSIDDVYPQTADVSNFVVSPPAPVVSSSPAIPSTTTEDVAPKDNTVQYVPTPIAQIALARRRHKMAKKAKTSTPTYVPTPLSQIAVQPESNLSSQKYKLTDSLANEGDDSEYDPTKISCGLSSETKSQKYSLDCGVPAADDEYDPFENGSLAPLGKAKAADLLETEVSRKEGLLGNHVYNQKPTQAGRKGELAFKPDALDEDDGLYDFDSLEKNEEKIEEIDEYDPFHDDSSLSSQHAAKYTPTAKYSMSTLHLEQGDEMEYDPCSNFSSQETFDKRQNVGKGSELSKPDESSDSDALIIDEKADKKWKASSSDEEPPLKKQKLVDDPNSTLENDRTLVEDKASDVWLGDLAQDNFLVGGCVNFDPPTETVSRFNPSYSYNPGETLQEKGGFSSSDSEMNPMDYLKMLSKPSMDSSCTKEKVKTQTSNAGSEKKTVQDRKAVSQEIKTMSLKSNSVCEPKKKSLNKNASKHKELSKEKQAGVSKNEEKRENGKKETNSAKENTNVDGKSNDLETSEKSRPTVSSDQLSSFFKRMNEQKSQKAKGTANKDRSQPAAKIAKTKPAVESEKPKRSTETGKTSPKLATKQETKQLALSDRKQDSRSDAKSRNLSEKGKVIVIDSSSSSEDNSAKPSSSATGNSAPKASSGSSPKNSKILAAKISTRKASTKLLFGDDSDSDSSDVLIVKKPSEDEIFLISDASSGNERKRKAKEVTTAKESSLAIAVKPIKNKGADNNSLGDTGSSKANDRTTSGKTSKLSSSQTQHSQKSSQKDHAHKSSSHQKTTKESKLSSSQKYHHPKSSKGDKLHQGSSYPKLKVKPSTNKGKVEDSSPRSRTKSMVNETISQTRPKVPQFETSDDKISGFLPDFGLESGSASDCEDPNWSDEYDVTDLELSLSESDTFEECLRIFQEESGEAPIKKPRQPQREPTLSRSEDLVSSTGKQRVAHVSKFNSSTQSKYRKCAPKPKARLTPLQVCHNRYMQAQQRLHEQQDRRDEEKPPTKENPAGFTTPSANANRRIAHVPSSRPQVPSSSSNTGNKSPVLSPVVGINAKIQQKYSIGHSESPGKTVAITAPKGERRLAHAPKKVNPRPIIPPDSAAKVPTNVRQRYLNLFIDEFLKTTQSEQEAFEQGLKEEKGVYERATSKNIYLNLSINTLKRLRTAQAPIHPTTTSPGKGSISHEAVIGGKPATQHTYTLNRSLHSRLASQEEKYEGAFLYKKLKPYLLTEEQLVENKYPRPSDTPGLATVKEEDAKKRTSADPNQHICSRCGKTFLRRPDGRYITRESCTYHWGKFWHNKVGGSIEGRFNCCSGTSDAKGCCIAKYHVTDDKTSNLTGFMKTVAKSPPRNGHPGLYAIDCEMCYTVKALELTRVTVIDDKLECVYDTLVKPSSEIVDYNTRFSGITEEDLKSATTTLQDVQAVLLSMFSSDSILIGHSLESDMLALKMIHSTVIDTAVLFPHRRGLPFKRALRTLMAECLNRIIQNDVGGHDSQEDAKSCMELMIWKAKQDAKIKKSSL